MATDAKGKKITQEAINSMEEYNDYVRLHRNDIKISVSIKFDLDYSLFHGSDEDGEIYESILPKCVTNNIYYPLSIGEEITFDKYYTPNDNIEKKFKVTKIEKHIDEGPEDEDEYTLDYYTIVSVIPIDEHPVEE